MRNFPGSSFFFLVRTAWHYAGREERRGMIVFYILFLFSNIVASLQPFVLARLINTAQIGGSDAINTVILLSLLYGGLSLLSWIFHGPARVIERRSAFVISRNFISSLYRLVTEMPLRWHQDHHSGSTINRIREAERALFQFAQGQFITIRIFVQIIASVALLGFFSAWVAITSILFGFIVILTIRLFNRDLVPLVRQTNESEHHLSSALYDYIGDEEIFLATDQR
jgi:ABC-type multidrug transport system fused ATPase/permease subunit